MPPELSVSQLRSEINQIFTADPVHAENRIEDYLNHQLKHLSLQKRINLLQQVAARSDSGKILSMSASLAQQNILADLFMLFLGKKASDMDIQSEKQLKQLADALNTIFDLLNELLGVINISLKGATYQQETIRGLIGKGLTDASVGVSLEKHLGQIKQAFLLSREALKDATREIVNDILTELDPTAMDNAQQGIPLGRFRKVGMLSRLKKKHQRCRLWFESDRFEQKLMREFEKHCSKYFEG